MRGKKILAAAVAAVMTVTVCLPVFAEDEEEKASAGEAAQGEALKLIAMTQNPEMDVEEAKTSMQELTDNLQDTDATVSSEMMTAAMSFFGTMESKHPDSLYKENSKATDGDVELSYLCKAGDKIDVDSFSVDENGKITLTADGVPSDGQSLGFGCFLSFSLPDDTNATKYKIEITNGDNQKIDAELPVTSYIDDQGVARKMVSVWVPHFTTYVLTPLSLSTTTTTTEPSATSAPSATAAPSATVTAKESIQYYTCPACGYHDWTATEDGYRCDNCGYVESQKQLSGYGNVKGVYSPKTGAENPIKATGSDMNLSVFVVVALIAAAACGMGITANKSRKSE